MKPMISIGTQDFEFLRKNKGLHKAGGSMRFYDLNGKLVKEYDTIYANCIQIMKSIS